MVAAPVRTAVLTSRVLRALPVTAFIALTALAVPITMRASAAQDRQTARAAVLAAARAEVSDLVNISYRTAPRDLDRIVAGATGRMAQLFAAQRAQLQLLTRTQSVTTGSVLSVGLTRLDLDNGVARVDAAADASVTDAQHPQPLLKHCRWVLTLLREHGHWLVSDAALAGVPQ